MNQLADSINKFIKYLEIEMITILIDEKFLLVFQLNRFSRLHQAPERFLSTVSMTKFEQAQPMRKKQKKNIERIQLNVNVQKKDLTS